MPARLKTKIPNIKKHIVRYEEAFDKAGEDIFKATIPRIRERMQMVFERGQDGWRELTEPYKKFKARMGLRPEKLRATDEFYNAIAVGSTDSDIKIEKYKMTYGISSRLWKDHVKYSQGYGRPNAFRPFRIIKEDMVKIRSKIFTEARKVLKKVKPLTSK